MINHGPARSNCNDRPFSKDRSESVSVRVEGDNAAFISAAAFFPSPELGEEKKNNSVNERKWGGSCGGGLLINHSRLPALVLPVLLRVPDVMDKKTLEITCLRLKFHSH